jgi:hypothetical protein
MAAAMAEWRVTGDATRAADEARRAFEIGDVQAVRAAGFALSELAQNGLSALPAVVARLSRDRAVASDCGPFLAKLGADAASAVTALLYAAESGAEHRAAVVATLTAIGPDARAAVPYLTAELAATRDDREEIALLRALAAIGPDAAAGLPQIRLRLRDWHANVAAAAEAARARIEAR